jgi:nucleoside-diphosphate-sugar epimerase
MVNRAIQNQELVIFGEGSRTQDFLRCEDAALAVLVAFQTGARGAYNIGTGVAVSLIELARAVNEVFAANKSRLVFQPQEQDDDPGIRLDIGKASRELQFRPRFQLVDGLRRLKQEMSERPAGAAEHQ